ncbi:PAS domain-containing protein [Pedococcus sp. NPDC057267]|uniref:PAS domain-containing protein n=1 Tax=Pedococcus sp. NPDC057267 TaxID=3346077 RepID=UPI003626AE6E
MGQSSHTAAQGPTRLVGPEAAEVLDLLPAGVTVWNRELRCDFANAFALRESGREELAEVRGRHVRELVPEPVWQSIRPFLEAGLAGTEQQYARTIEDAAGQVRQVQVSCAPFVVDREVVGVLQHLIDITARIDAEALLRHRAEARAVDRERRRVADVTTDIVARQLFGATLKLSGALSQDPARDSGPLWEAMGDIDRAIAALRDLIAGPAPNAAGAQAVAGALAPNRRPS